MDAFGQHYATNARFDDQSTRAASSEAAALCDIVMPFGRGRQDIEKASQLTQDRPRGAIWKLPKILKAYSDWGSGAPREAGSCTHHGPTATMAEHIADGSHRSRGCVLWVRTPTGAGSSRRSRMRGRWSSGRPPKQHHVLARRTWCSISGPAPVAASPSPAPDGRRRTRAQRSCRPRPELPEDPQVNWSHEAKEKRDGSPQAPS